MAITRFTRKQTLKGSTYKKSHLFQDKILANEKIAGVLNQKREKRDFYDKFREDFKGHRVKNKDLKEFFWKLKQDKNDSLSDKEVRTIARQFITSGKKYLQPSASTDHRAKVTGDKNKSSAPTVPDWARDGKTISEKINSGGTDSPSMANLPMMPESFFKSNKIAEEVSGENDETVKPGGIYDLIRERNQMSDEDKK